MRNDLDDVVLLDVDHAERGIEQENNLARKKTDVVGKRSEYALSRASEVISRSRPIDLSSPWKRRCREAAPPFIPKIECDSVSTSAYTRCPP
jgi:hypothetical protein